MSNKQPFSSLHYNSYVHITPLRCNPRPITPHEERASNPTPTIIPPGTPPLGRQKSQPVSQSSHDMTSYHRRPREDASDETDDALRGVKAERGLHSSCTCLEASGLVKIGPPCSSRPPTPLPPLAPPERPLRRTTGERTASSLILASDGGGRPSNLMLFGEPGRTVTGWPYDETDTSSEDIIDGGGDDVWLVVPDTPMKADPPLSTSPPPSPPLWLSLSRPPPPPPRNPRRLAPQPPSDPPPRSSGRSRLWPWPRVFAESQPRGPDDERSPLLPPLPPPLPFPPPLPSISVHSAGTRCC